MVVMLGSGQVMGFCRIPLSSCHPQIPVWCLNKPRLLIMNRADMVSLQDQQEWSNYYGSQGLSVFNTDANNGKGITKVTHCMLSASLPSVCTLPFSQCKLPPVGLAAAAAAAAVCYLLLLLPVTAASATSRHHPCFTPPLYPQHAVQTSMH